MTDCTDSLRELQRFLDGELDDADCAEVLAHLGECLECHHAYDFHAELRQVIAAKCGADPLPDGLLDRIAAALTAELDAAGPATSGPSTSVPPTSAASGEGIGLGESAAPAAGS